ncbi:hypothetical protein [Clostridium botulinum]|uniref:Uncharacterized protein n=1 Tax=Clostridium botulinum (strain Hall / ATCC 3502 / NCTC 13319 / Type A) TaxID=441771 RepID=A5I3K9_CLOBH|nr:hypothetical protein [Clostridium botulinum]ABS33155.1 hypothetical protein CLB_2025 [Clostridium botulinum A str. ATCC 19397]ABS37571.1 hypothetical protein CLC_2030 [Clostridium botulinum A str. Hall]AWB17952.1 hypothetical protein DB732_10855 [Clostridium botulinum]AWB30733.1 hypothetical protein DBN47_10825 [Clostridium botulinum]EGT5614402.1 hypothetical protein [Clostridium botulinum]
MLIPVKIKNSIEIEDVEIENINFRSLEASSTQSFSMITRVCK